MKYFHSFFLLVAFVGMALHSQAQKAAASKALLKRTYYDYQGRQLHEEYQYVSTPTNRFSKQGYYKEYNEDGTLWRKHNYRNNKANGRQLEYSTSEGETWLEYDIMVHDNLRNGLYIRYSGPNERISAGNYVNGSREGQWKFYYPEGYEVCTYRNDKKESPATLFYKSGKVADQYSYREDEKYNDGDVKAFYEDGTPKKSGHFTDGQMDGKFLAWYPNGQLRYEENYVADQQAGLTLAYDENGNVITKDFYEAGILVRHEKSAVEIAREAQHDAANKQYDRRKQERDSIEQVEMRRVAAREANEVIQQKINDAFRDAQSTQAILATIGSGHSSPDATLVAYRLHTALQPKLYADLYARLLAECPQAPNLTEKLARVQRLNKLLELAQALAMGQQPDLNKAIRKEADLDKVLALTGL